MRAREKGKLLNGLSQSLSCGPTSSHLSFNKVYFYLACSFYLSFNFIFILVRRTILNGDLDEAHVVAAPGVAEGLDELLRNWRPRKQEGVGEMNFSLVLFLWGAKLCTRDVTGVGHDFFCFGVRDRGGDVGTIHHKKKTVSFSFPFPCNNTRIFLIGCLNPD